MYQKKGEVKMLFKSLVYLILILNIVGLPSSWKNYNTMRPNQLQKTNLSTIMGENNVGELTNSLNGNEINWNLTDNNAVDFKSVVEASNENPESGVNSATSPIENENLDDKLDDTWALDNDEFGDYLILKGINHECYGGNTLVRDTVERALQQNPSITRIKIADGVKVIGQEAFEGSRYVDYMFLNKCPACNNITQIDIPDSVSDIFDYAFAGCTALTELKLPKNLKFIGDHAFDSLKGLTKIDIPEGVTYIGRETFTYCTNLTTVYLPNSLKYIGIEAFANCTSLTSVSIPESVKVGFGAFYGCESLTDVNISAKSSKIAANAFLDCKNIKHITAPHIFSSLKLQFPDAIIDYNDTEESYLEAKNKARREAHKLTSELSSSLNFSDLLKSYEDKHKEIINMHDSLRASANNHFSLAIDEYIRHTRCNSDLRSKDNIETCKDFLAEMDGIFAQEPPLEKGQEFYVYRGVGENFLKWLLDINNISTPFGITNNKVKKLIGTVFSDPAYLSTSVDVNFAHSWSGPVIMRIYLPKGSKVLPIGGKHQLEVLLNRNSKIKIKDIQILYTKRCPGKEYLIDAELIPDTPNCQDIA